MEVDELERLLLRKVRGVTYEETQYGYTLLIVTDKGKNFFFTSESPIDLDVEQEQ